SELTNSNMMMGTLNYMAPEQLRGERADPRSDIFSVGVVIYELLSGRKAFHGDSFASTLFKILETSPQPLHEIDHTLPPDIAAIVEGWVAKSRAHRYQHVSELLSGLVSLRQQLGFQDASSRGYSAIGSRVPGEVSGPFTPPAATTPPYDVSASEAPT